ncbi:ABC transporter substrate-binding protein [Ramlibacter albus]|uniref:ABC transporter substrate-binding protein n=1 Tax=Ramlibacter albus TaxID=2079448 RepID=A0A923M993_9BURK|nr:ABC transporter substrate-binding protein [Ramlibacter albus]MBC5765114.1 ABC transporter substrate-binding protein [Ramlibacter albus]
MQNPPAAGARRAVLASGVALVLARAGDAAAQAAPAVLAVLATASEHDDAGTARSFKRVLETSGMVQGKDFVLEFFWAGGDYKRFPGLARAAVAAKPAAILVTTAAAALAAKHATSTIPIVMFGINDPVGSGLVASFAQPGGNITGTASMTEDYVGKLLELTREALPGTKRIAVLLNPLNPSNRPIFRTFERLARRDGIAAQAVEISAPEQIEPALAQLARRRPDAMITGLDSSLTAARAHFAAFSAAQGVPIVSVDGNFSTSGALVTYTAEYALAKMASVYVRKILAGARPQDLPVQQPTSFTLAVNMKVAQALGVKVPQTLLVRATRVIE